LLKLNTQIRGAQTEYDTLVQALSEVAPVVSDFFDGPDSVLVMDPDPAIKQNRLNLLGLLRNQVRTLANFGAIVKSADG
jgi:glycyl-tRNA synthetase beta chain